MTASERIVWHAGLSAAGGLASGSVSAVTSDGDPTAVEVATADLISALAAFNHDFNGSVPSETVGHGDDSVSRNVAYAVGEAVWMLRESGSDQSARRVEYAWLAVLAGDVDDIHQHLAEEGLG